MKRVLFYILCLFAVLYGTGTGIYASDIKPGSHTFSGIILDKTTGEPVEFATVVLNLSEQWAITDKTGSFSIKNVPDGKNIVVVSYLGYVTVQKEIVINRDIANFTIKLAQDNLTLNEVVVSAKDNSSTATTSRTIDKTSLEHIQMVNVSDVSALLPGGRTLNPTLTTSQTINIRSEGTAEMGNSSFGTAIEVDGVRISNNASFGNLSTSSSLKGVTTNNIASTSVESVEVISGLPSVEYGDVGTGVVKINTKKGVSKWIISLSTNPTLKQASIGKGFDLGTAKSGASKGVLNANAEYTKAIQDPRSPFTSYTRQTASLSYNNLIARGIFTDTPLKLSTNLSGNIGGLDSSADPDLLRDTWTKSRDNAVRANMSLNWLLSKSWITNMEINASISYSDKLSKEKELYSYTAAQAALHGTNKGYFVATYYSDDPQASVLLVPRGHHFNTMVTDDKPLTTKLALKLNWAKKFGNINNKVKAGADWTSEMNFGEGLYSEDLSTAPTFRKYPYNQVPTMHNVAAYLEDNLLLPIGKSKLNIIAGLRWDNTLIDGSQYGNTSSLSPRVNAKYTFKKISIRASWGIAVKQPSFSILYPIPTYRDIETFRSTSTIDGSAYYAYYIMPKQINYNPALRWQQNRQAEIGIDANLAGHKISVSAYLNRTINPYCLSTGYDVFTYNYTNTATLTTDCTIAPENRLFEVNQNTGIVTVHDKTGILSDQELPYTSKRSFNPNTYADNGTDPITRYGLEWVIDFKRIKALNTSIRLDGSFYSYRAVNHKLTADSPYTILSSDRTPYKYVGYYVGGNGLSNGSESRNLRTNLSINTNIPKIRMILTLRLEAGLLKYNRYLSEGSSGNTRSYAISDKNDILSFTDKNIYEKDQYIVTFPDKYASIDSPNELKDYLADLKWAKDNNPELFNDLSKLATTSSLLYFFNKDYISPYFCANFSVTKEIADIASISFYANNFFNNLSQVYSSRANSYTSASNYIPSFFYGLSLRLKF